MKIINQEAFIRLAPTMALSYATTDHVNSLGKNTVSENLASLIQLDESANSSDSDIQSVNKIFSAYKNLIDIYLMSGETKNKQQFLELRTIFAEAERIKQDFNLNIIETGTKFVDYMLANGYFMSRK